MLTITNGIYFQVSPLPDVNQVPGSGNSALHTSVYVGNPRITQMLIDAGADVNLWNPECQGATPLHLAVWHGKNICETSYANEPKVQLKLTNQMQGPYHEILNPRF